MRLRYNMLTYFIQESKKIVPEGNKMETWCFERSLNDLASEMAQFQMSTSFKIPSGSSVVVSNLYVQIFMSICIYISIIQSVEG